MTGGPVIFPTFRPPGVSEAYGTMAPMGELPDYAERVLEVAELIPAGRVLTYGDVARWLREDAGERAADAGRSGAIPRVGGPRQVGRVMALYGGGVPWWRVVRADGVLLRGSEERALGHYRDEGTPLRPAGAGGGPRLDLRRARWAGPGGPDGS
ncbi:hypothetical protein GCM10023347_31440 [Streptomyces chumphonensis]